MKLLFSPDQIPAATRLPSKSSLPLLAVLSVAFLFAFKVPVQAQQQEKGETLFSQRCSACHSLKPGQTKMGPSLAGIVGRKAGSVARARYSKALQNADLVWNNASLDQFLTNPGKKVPGTRMTVRLPDAGQRRAIIEFLNRQ
ncbi:c-type cytochrome [Thalassospira marina]|uniref:c-type cytochrome n=1 Tax=Thalassospira marina TaxID=2048283 RepID=UPI001FE4EC06|nr:c-type cytochrome [Thalassospira marina]